MGERLAAGRPEAGRVMPGRDISRVAVIDVGSNTVRLVIFDGAARAPAYFYNEKVMCGLGARLDSTGRLDPEGWSRALRALRRFALVLSGMGISSVRAVATAAVRDAEDGPAFRSEVARETGLALEVIPGEEEARLSAQGVLLGWPEAEGLVADMGGASMELARVADGAVGARASGRLGPLSLAGLAGGRKGRKARIREELTRLAATVGGGAETLYLVGGSFRALARLDMLRRDYPLHVLHEYAMKPSQLRATLDWLARRDPDRLRKRACISAERMRLLPIAGEVLRATLQVIRPRRLAVSAYGLREGLLYEEMPEELRRRDPLIEAARFAEAQSARMPGFGEALFEFLLPLYRNEPRARLRLIRAACHLHDVSWRAHPDYRAEVVFDNVTRANLSGISHEERVFLGLALLHRYKNRRAGARFAPLFALLDAARAQEAEVLGKAMRFGAMFSVQNRELMGRLAWRPRKRELIFSIPAASADLMGEVAETRFRQLCEALEARGTVCIV